MQSLNPDYKMCTSSMCEQSNAKFEWKGIKTVEVTDYRIQTQSMRGPRKIIRGRPMIFLIDEGKEDPNATINGHRQPANETPFKWRFADVPMIAQH